VTKPLRLLNLWLREPLGALMLIMVCLTWLASGEARFLGWWFAAGIVFIAWRDTKDNPSTRRG